MLALALFLLLPRPPVLGFGFLPPGSDDPTQVPIPIRKGGEAGAGNSSGSGSGSAGSTSSPTASGPGAWAQMVQGMRPATQDRHMPEWQRGLLGSLLDAIAPRDEVGDGRTGAVSKTQGGVLQIKLWWFATLPLAALLAWWAWRRRYAIALKALSLVAWAVIPISPRRSMRVSARMIEYCLAWTDCPRPAALTLRERLALAHKLPSLSSQLFELAVATYYASRFGRTEANASGAARMRLDVLDGADVAIAHATR